MAFALVESGKITKLINGNKGIKIGVDIQYSHFLQQFMEQKEMLQLVFTQ